MSKEEDNDLNGLKLPSYIQYAKMSKEEDNDLDGLKMDELRKIGKELDVKGNNKINLKRNIKAARKEREKKKQEEEKKKQEELKIRNEELAKRKEIQEKQQSKKKTLNAQQMLDKKHPEKAIKAYPKEIVDRAKQKLATNEKKREKENECDDYDLYTTCTEETFVQVTWEDLDTQEQLDLLIQAAAEYAKEDIDKTEETAEKKNEGRRRRKEKVAKNRRRNAKKEERAGDKTKK